MVAYTYSAPYNFALYTSKYVSIIRHHILNCTYKLWTGGLAGFTLRCLLPDLPHASGLPDRDAGYVPASVGSWDGAWRHQGRQDGLQGGTNRSGRYYTRRYGADDALGGWGGVCFKIIVSCFWRVGRSLLHCLTNWMLTTNLNAIVTILE